MLALEPGAVVTTRGTIRTARTVVAVGHDVDRFFPEAADEHGLLRCRLRMMEVDTPVGAVPPAVLTGSSMLRYDGFAQQPSAADVRAELLAESPALLEQGVNLMLTQRPNGRLVIGDTHHYGVTEDPFEDEASDALVLAEMERLFGVRSPCAAAGAASTPPARRRPSSSPSRCRASPSRPSPPASG